MKKPTSQIFVAVVCALLGFLLAYQFKILAKKGDVNTQYNNSDILSEVENLKKEKEELVSNNANLTEELKKLEESAATNGKVDMEVKKSLDNARLQLGLVDVKGPGMTITLAPKTPIFGSEQYDSGMELGEGELIHLVNTLWYYGAEAVSIQDTRITAQTGIKNAGSAVWLGTAKKISPKDKIVIKAVGDKKKLSTGINFPGVMQYGALVNYNPEIMPSDDITIEKTNQQYKTDYVKPIN